MQERMVKFTNGFDHVSETKLSSLQSIELEPNSIRIIELMK
jgi:hypothetical protein